MAKSQADVLRPLYDFVEELCTIEQVQSLLRKAKKSDKKVRVVEINKSKVVHTNLRKAVGSLAVSVKAVQNLVRDAEENGSQHIFLYRPRNKQVAEAYRDGDKVARKLFGAAWPNGVEIPQYLKLPDKEEWVDFRIVDGDGWIAKAYGRQTITERVGAEEPDRVEDGVEYVIQRLRRMVVRTTLLMRYSAKNSMLELRLPLAYSRRSLNSLHDRFRALARNAVHVDNDFVPWNLATTRMNFVRGYDPRNGVYRIKDTRFENDAHDTASFSAFDGEGEGDLFADAQLRQAINTIIRGSQECPHLAFWFLKTGSTDALKEDLRVSMGSYATNELMIGAHTTPAAVDYVLHRIREKS
jgi:hypothetical protein